MMIVSFIIPVYNVEKYLAECLDSILIDDEKNTYEILLIDDGSTDSSANICDDYAKRDNRIKVIHKENEGVAIARNVGINLARGKYLAFVDADDRLAKNSVLEIIKWAQCAKEEVCFLQAIKFFPDGSEQDLGDKIFEKDLKNNGDEQFFRYLAKRPKFPGSVWAKLFLREFIEKKKITFPVGRKHGEDLAFCRDCFYCAETFSCLDMPYYEYRQNRIGSATQRIDMGMFYDISKFISESVALFCNEKKPKNPKAKHLMSFVAYEYTILLWRLSRFDGENYQTIYKFLQEYKWVLRYGKSQKGKCIFFLSRVVNIKFLSKIIALIKR